MKIVIALDPFKSRLLADAAENVIRTFVSGRRKEKHKRMTL